MNQATQIVLWTALTLSWLLIPLVIVQYRLVVVPRRFDEIRDRFPAERREPHREPAGAGTFAALLYTRLLKPMAFDAEAEQFVAAQFWYFHRWNRYAPPLV